MNTITGTIEQFIKSGLSLNNVVLDQAMLSVLTRLGKGTFAKEVGKVKTSQGKGKPATIWELTLNSEFNFSVQKND